MASTPVTRRQAIRMMALGGLALGLGVGELRELASSKNRLSRVHETRLLMGTVATLTVLTDRPDAARAAIDAAFAKMDRLEQIFSRFRSSSEVSCLNRTGSLSGASPELCQLLSRALAYGERTNGAFDVTIAPLLHAYRAASRQGAMPDDKTIAALKELVDYRQIRQRGNTIEFGRTGMALTLDGLAKGYILDAGADEFVRLGYADVLVEAGGDLMARGMTVQGGWRVGIQSPRSSGAVELIGTINVENAALATSGDYRQTFNGYEQFHILDPHTGASPTSLSSVTVVAPTACDADALSTGLMVLEPSVGLALIRDGAHTRALTVDKGGRMRRSEHFPNFETVTKASQ